MSLCISTGRMAYEQGGDRSTRDLAAGLEPPLSIIEGESDIEPGSATAEKAADMLNAVSGPREVAGVSVSDNGRRQIIALFKQAGLTEKQAMTIVDNGVLPVALASRRPSNEVATQIGHLDPAVKAALATLKPVDRQGRGKHSIEVGTAEGEAAPKETAGATPPPGDGKRSYSVTEQDGVHQPSGDEDASDALGDLVDALNPFQRWTRSSFAVFSTKVAPSFSAETGEVKVTVTSETRQGVTITTEITQPVDGEIPTVVTQATDSRTGEALTDPITATAPSVETVSSVCLGQLAQGLTEAREEQKEKREERREQRAERAATPPEGSAVDKPQEPAEGRDEPLGAPVPGSSREGAERGSEAGDGLSGEPLGDLPQHAAA
ncbi:hypothetical protein [Streptomyces sp. NPDC055794]